ncbi:HU-CCDC81 and SPOR domain-containing protein [Clostridium saccharoperbutylacetonicum]|uniref:SMODS-associated NUDIX domain-containing protein n=1 Tax=Clostridium saccharoperbutylacetonicum TaxID=36745 RepID=UPI0009839CA1|nr:HU-CCDC81 and SPOR domain-containing protein [Clostridium saccharoperbutylacetonicum]AQR96489.1 hypothetical protein CLSAP_38130 [Clostridium saccharoperbutylacetonicum]NSB32363.1 hypothetical protein [Clostridium saccharoperbutylacetonicum]
MDNPIGSIVINLISTLIGGLIVYIYTNRNELKNIFLLKCKYRNQDIRSSISYLFRIENDGKYLLVKNRKITEQYQPVGGVYKYYDSAGTIFAKLGVKKFSGYAHEERYKNDLRVKVPSKKLNKFIMWFNSREDRELDPIREFVEELIEPNFISKDVFLYFNYRFIKQVTTPIKYSQQFKCNEILIYNIYELLPNKKQKMELDKMMEIENENYKWVTLEEIERLGYNEAGGCRIGEHTQYTI